MAMYENLGYCPNNAFGWADPQHVDSILWPVTRELLGDRIGYMYYPKGDTTNAMSVLREVDGHCSAVSCLRFAQSTLGAEIAAALSVMIPRCRYAQIGKPIECFDIPSHDFLPVTLKLAKHYVYDSGAYHEYDRFEIADTDPTPNTVLLQDERYLVTITNDEDAIRICFCYEPDDSRIIPVTDKIVI